MCDNLFSWIYHSCSLWLILGHTDSLFQCVWYLWLLMTWVSVWLFNPINRGPKFSPWKMYLCHSHCINQPVGVTAFTGQHGLSYAYRPELHWKGFNALITHCVHPLHIAMCNLVLTGYHHKINDVPYIWKFCKHLWYLLLNPLLLSFNQAIWLQYGMKSLSLDF